VQIELIQAFEGDIGDLATADQYFSKVSPLRPASGTHQDKPTTLQIMLIPRLPERLTCMLYRRKLELDMEELKPESLILRAATEELKQSIKLKRILAVRGLYSRRRLSPCSSLLRQTVLAIGNSLNASTFRGNAQGFQLNALDKVSLILPLNSVSNGD
jgi:diaphanous 1